MEKVLLGLLGLTAADRETLFDGNGTPARTELVLSSLGWTIGEIAYVTGRKYEAVKATIRRNREPRR